MIIWGGGFFRYSTDEQWMIPHFEKMLYDNAQLLSIYADASAIFNNPLYRNVVKETANWVIREMQLMTGGYSSSLDADSAGTEGKFYYWDAEDVKHLLTAEEFTVFANQYGLDHEPNFDKHWHLYLQHNSVSLREKLDYPLSKIKELSHSAKQKLFSARSERIPPGKDKKMLTAWNGLMIKGMAKAGIVLSNEKYLDSAQQALDFIREKLWINQRLHACHNGEEAYLNAYLDDYVFVIDGILTLLQARWRSEDLEFACELADATLKHYQDSKVGGFFFTAHDHEKLLTRPKQFMDEALPSGNGVAVRSFLKLGFILGEQRYLDAAENTLKAATQTIKQHPSAYNNLLSGLLRYRHHPKIIVLRGEQQEIAKWQQAFFENYNPMRLCFAINNDVQSLPDAMTHYPTTDKTTAYICQGTQCLAPIQDFKKFAATLTA